MNLGEASKILAEMYEREPYGGRKTALSVALVALDAMMEKMPPTIWWEFHQNNSGGYYTKPAMKVFVAAETQDEAYEKLSATEGFTTEFCDCCGERWGSAWEVDDLNVLKVLNEGGTPGAEVYNLERAEEDGTRAVLVLR